MQNERLVWHRAEGTETIGDGRYWKRPFLHPTPVLRQDMSLFLTYPVQKELGVSLSLSESGHHLSPHWQGGAFKGAYPELLAKQAVWFVKHLCEHTDMVECGVPIRLGITEDLREVATPYLEACQFPMHAVDWFESRESTHRQSSKYDAMRQLAFHDIEKILHLDMTYLIGTHPTQRLLPLFSRILEQWGDEPVALAEPLLWDRAGNTNNVEWYVNADEYPCWAEGVSHPFWNMAAIICAETPEAQYNYWHTADPMYRIGCGVIGIRHDFLWDESMFWGLFEKILAISNDEVAFCVCAYHQKWKNTYAANLHKSFNWEGPPFHRNPYWTRPFCYTDEQMPTDLWLSMHRGSA